MAVTPTQTAEQPSAESLYRRYARDVFSLAYRAVGSRAEAEDVTQTTFLNAHRALLDGVEPEEERAWLLTIARNVCHSRFRTLHRRPREEPLDESLPVPGIEDGESTAQVVDALRTLLPRQRAALVLQTVDGCSTAEIGARLGLGSSAVDALLHRARAALRDELYGAELVPCARTEALVRLQLRGELDGDQQAGLRAHLRACSCCATSARRLRARKRFGSLLALPWELAHRLVGLFAQSSGAVKAATVLGALTIGTTVAVESGTDRPSGADTPASRPAAAEAARPPVTLIGLLSRGSVAHTPPPQGRELREEPGRGGGAIPSPRGAPAAEGIPGGGTAAGSPSQPPPGAAPAPAGSSHALATFTKGATDSALVGAGGASASASVSLGSEGAALGVRLDTGPIDAHAHVSAGVSPSTGVAASTDVGASAPAVGSVGASATVSASAGVSASVGVGVPGSQAATATVSVPPPDPPPLVAPSLPGLPQVGVLLGG